MQGKTIADALPGVHTALCLTGSGAAGDDLPLSVQYVLSPKSIQNDFSTVFVSTVTFYQFMVDLVDKSPAWYDMALEMHSPELCKTNI